VDTTVPHDTNTGGRTVFIQKTGKATYHNTKRNGLYVRETNSLLDRTLHEKLSQTGVEQRWNKWKQDFIGKFLQMRERTRRVEISSKIVSSKQNLSNADTESG
jgi:hypothetical protein